MSNFQVWATIIDSHLTREPTASPVLTKWLIWELTILVTMHKWLPKLVAKFWLPNLVVYQTVNYRSPWDTLRPLLLTWINFNPSMDYIIASIVKCELKLMIHSQTSMIHRSLGMDKKNSSHTLLGMCLLIHALRLNYAMLVKGASCVILDCELGPSGVSPNQRSRWKHAFSPLKYI